MKLISMIQFIKNNPETSTIDMDEFDYYYKESNILDKIRFYADFLSQPLDLSMFVPLDENGDILEKPDLTCKRPDSKVNCYCGEESVKYCREWWLEWIEAEERVIFKNFVFYKEDSESFSLNLIDTDGSETFTFMKKETIEDLLTFDYEFEFTELCIKKMLL